MPIEQSPNQHRDPAIETIFGDIPSPSEQLDRVLSELGLEDDIREAIFADIDRRLQALRAASASADEYLERFMTGVNQGQQWKAGRERAGMRIDIAADSLGISIWELMLLEVGMPDPDGVQDELTGKLNSLYQIPNE